LRSIDALIEKLNFCVIGNNFPPTWERTGVFTWICRIGSVREYMTKRSQAVVTKKAGRGAVLRPIGVIRSTLKSRSEAPKQGYEGAPNAWLEVHPFAVPATDGLAAGDEIIVVTWFHRSRREVLKVHPRSDPRRKLTGVFATRSPDRPNPLGFHRVTIRRIANGRLRIGPIEAIDGTPVVDIKPVLAVFDQ
jgi:tRNA-Thr(GGU) m(6)t(6)A37 methyltransferase TsaA